MARRYRFIRRADGSILDVREAGDAVFDLLWLQDEDVRDFFAQRDRARRIAAGSTAAAEDERERLEAAARDRLLARLRRI